MTSSLLQVAFFVVGSNRCLAQFLSLRDLVCLAMSAKCMAPFHEQVPVLLIPGAHCFSLRKLYRYLQQARRRGQRHLHAKLYVDEIVDIDKHLCPQATETLLLQPPLLNWHPYAVLRHVAWLERFTQLQHLDVSLNGESATAFTHLLRGHLPLLQALVVFSNDPVPGLWTGLVHMPRPSLVSVSVNNFPLDDVPLGHVHNLRFLWISRPCRRRHHAAFLRRVCEDLPALAYLSTVDFKGFAKHAELVAWMDCLAGATMPSLRYWETEGSDLVDMDLVARSLRRRRLPLTIQGLQMRDACVAIDPGHRLLSGRRDVSLHLPRIYKSLDVLAHVVHTRIPTATGPAFFRGRNV